ncbi:hypothetical protein [Micromonospora endophytica]|uniref:hypothetical protein n=1 Tax=Micromonospora endophytica TaxID=515350 RepID=UPI001BB3D028|nr:hypothetical protein [Micromonospora endophytica]
MDLELPPHVVEHLGGIAVGRVLDRVDGHRPPGAAYGGRPDLRAQPPRQFAAAEPERVVPRPQCHRLGAGEPGGRSVQARDQPIRRPHDALVGQTVEHGEGDGETAAGQVGQFVEPDAEVAGVPLGHPLPDPVQVHPVVGAFLTDHHRQVGRHLEGDLRPTQIRHVRVQGGPRQQPGGEFGVAVQPPGEVADQDVAMRLRAPERDDVLPDVLVPQHRLGAQREHKPRVDPFQCRLELLEHPASHVVPTDRLAEQKARAAGQRLFTTGVLIEPAGEGAQVDAAVQVVDRTVRR